MTRKHLNFIILTLTIGLFLCVRMVSAQKKQYDVAAFVWPSYHPDDRAKIFWPEGIEEWQTVRSNNPKFEGHQHPLWGYINEADTYVAEMEINAAADHGVNVFIFDWYWYDGMPFLEGHLNDGYLQARNNNRVKFYLMWANPDFRLVVDKRNADDAFTRKNNALIWKGGIDREEFEKIAHRWIEKYFSHPSYYKIDGKPVLMIYSLPEFISGLGGVKQSGDALSWFRDEVRKAGFHDLELQYAMKRSGQVTDREVNKYGLQKELIEKLGFNSLTHYQFVHSTNVNRDYNEILKDVMADWKTNSNDSIIAYYPHVSVGWDNSPRAETFIGSVVTNNTPENFEKALRQARAFADALPGQVPLITINS